VSGSIRSQGKGSWELKFEAGADPATGKRKTIYRTVRGTKRQAEAKLIELLNQAADGTLVDRRKETLAQYLIRWDRDWVAINVSPKTRERWNQLRINQITPRLGSAPLQRIESSHLAELYATLTREGGVGGSRSPR
jgi:integrase